MVIPLVEAEDIKTGRTGRTKGERYGKYALAVEKHVSWLKEKIENSKDGTIRLKSIDLAKTLGEGFEKKNPTSLYWAMKYVLFNEGIVVDTGSHKDGEKLLLMRMGTEEDKLPPSLSKYVDKSPDEVPDDPEVHMDEDDDEKEHIEEKEKEKEEEEED